MGDEREWTEREDELLIKEFIDISDSPQITYREAAEILNRSRQSVRGRVRRLRKKSKRDSFQANAHKHSVKKYIVGNNEIVLESKSERIHTLKQLMEYCEVDTEVWTVERYIVNKWEVGAKEEKTDLTWERGQLSGSVKKSGKLTIKPLIQIKAWLRRKNPEPIIPTIKPIEINFQYKKPRQKTKPLKVAGTALIIPDAHIGFWRDPASEKLESLHDRRALDTILQVSQAYDFDKVIILGDLLDAAEWSNKFTREPEFEDTMQPAILEAFWWLGQFRNANQRAEISYIEGNHELRGNTQLIENLKYSYDLRAADEIHLPPAMSVPKLLALHQLGINYMGPYPDGEVWINETLRCEHGRLRSSPPGATARKVVEAHDTSTIFGHIHRIEQANRTIYTRHGLKTITGFSPGCVVKLNGYIPATHQRQNWQNGFAIVEYTENEFNIQSISIQNGSSIYFGGYEGRNEALIVEEIEDDLETKL